MDAVATISQPVDCPPWLQELNQHPTADSLLMTKAFTFAERLHRGQKRKSGEDYIIHPVAVAGLLWDLGGMPRWWLPVFCMTFWKIPR